MSGGAAGDGCPAATAPQPRRRPAVGAVVLAAGAGSRLGGRPKCLLELGGEPLIARTLRALADAGVAPVVVALGHHADRVGPVVAPFGVTTVRNAEPDAGPVSSQRLGLAALGDGPDAVVVALADQPLVDAADVAALIDAYDRRAAGVSVVFPQVDGAPGNPVIFDAGVRAAILASDAAVGCRQWRDAHPWATAPWITANAHYRIDIDTPDDLARFERETGRALHWPADLQAPAGTTTTAAARRKALP